MSRFDQCECKHLRGDHDGSAPQPCMHKVENGDKFDCPCTEFRLLHARPYATDPMDPPPR